MLMTAKPRRGLYFTEDNILCAQRNIANMPWAEHAFNRLKEQCSAFLDYSDEQIYDCVLGMKDQLFAYGIAGCPNCGKPFPMQPDEQRAMFSSMQELPHKRITCLNCRMMFPNEKFADTGEGLEVNGKGYYLIGMWNFYIGGELLGGVRNHEGMVTKLTYLYMLTGEVEYAHKALVILDAFAAINPGTIGPRDFTPYGSDFEIGRLHLLTSIVHRIKVCLAQDYDWLYSQPELDQPSPARAKLGQSGTMRENIEAMLNDYMLTEPGGPYYDLSDGNLTNLQNHESDGVRAMLAVGLVLDHKDYCSWGIRAVEAYIFNAIGRDGMYYEGSYGYSLFTGTVFLDVALLAMRASDREQPDHFNPFASDRFFKFAVQNPLEMLCQGHLPSYGDWGRDTTVGSEANAKIVVEAYRAALYFYQFTPDPEMKVKAACNLSVLYPLVHDELGARGIDLFFQHHDSDPNELFMLPKGNTFMGQAGIGITRDRNDTTLLMRVGPNHTHAHDDVLAYQYYVNGKEISADIGYGIYGTNSHYGWGTKAIAHNTVVVNNDRTMERNQLYKPFAGGEFSLVYESDPITAMEGTAPSLYDIGAYQRLIATVPIDDETSYVMDFFYIDGAETSDYVYRAFHDNSTIELTGAVEKDSDYWTLAGIDADEKPYFDYPGKSYGERLTTGETFAELLEDETVSQWTPPLNNGYGFVYKVKEYVVEQGMLRAVWQTEQGEKLNWFGLVGSKDRIFTGLCPSLEGTNQHPILVHRSEQPSKLYSSAVYSTSGDHAGSGIDRILPLPVRGEQAAAVHVVLSNGSSDYWVYSPVSSRLVVSTPGGEWLVNGRCAWLRTDAAGKRINSACIQAEHMEYQSFRTLGKQDAWFPIIRLDHVSSTLWLEGELDMNMGRYIRIRRSPADRGQLYPIKLITTEGGKTKVILHDSVVLSKGIVKQVGHDFIMSYYPLPLGFHSTAVQSPFVGKKLKGSIQGEAVITGIHDLKRLEVRFIKPFAVGEKFDIWDIESGYEVQGV